MGSSEVTLQEQLDLCNTRIKDALTNPKPSYSLGDRRFDWNGYLRWLNALKRNILDELQTIPVAEENVFDGGENVR